LRTAVHSVEDGFPTGLAGQPGQCPPRVPITNWFCLVIFRSGLRTDPESILLLRRFAADAMRHRIVFYTVDSRGLITINPSANRAKLLWYGVPIPTAAENNWLQFLNALNDYSRTEQLEIGREEGLKEVAKLTGGKAVTNTNDLRSLTTSWRMRAAIT
jgi:hypothetical protein